VAVAVGLGTIDMPVPQVEEWEWLNWKFPRPVHAGDTIYARWTLTQKRPPVGGTPTSVVVWRVDVHTADGALCAEGEVGAKVRRQAGAKDRERAAEPAATSAAAAAAPRRRRRRRPAGGNGPLTETPAIAAPSVAPAANQERASGAPRRRRRRSRPAGSAAARDGETVASQVSASEPVPTTTATSAPAGTAGRGGLSRVIRRLRRTQET
jgi:hypothetical protein